MGSRATSLLEAADRALQGGAWAAARDAFHAALDAGASAEAHLGLGVALFWLGDLGGSFAHLERAYRRRAGAPI